MQKFKSIYFADYPADTAKRRHLKLAFGLDDQELFGVVSPLSSEEIRRLLGMSSFTELRTRAETDGVSLNVFCLDRLRRVAERTPDGQMTFPELADATPELRIDPIQTTFRGGVEEPLHAWYPYLEGYSPEFVGSLLDTFAPKAQHVLDPFGGTGTTPLTAARRGLKGTYCELNPLLQFLIETKVGVLALQPRERGALARLLRSLSGDLPKAVHACTPDRRLASAYPATFGDSVFFPEVTLDVVLRLRSWLDSLACTAPDAAAVATVASAAALIPASNLVRRGDLRFRKGVAEASLRVPDIIREVSARLLLMAQDVERLDGILHRPWLLAGDAKRLDRCTPLGVDVVVTSPPYLNGTNYYRNTKVELWFLRALLAEDDLAAFRRQTVTAGINDVTADKNSVAPTQSVEDLVRTLERDAYDRRIPQMVVSYFADMARIFDGLARHLKSGAPMLVDIGDSAYAGVHVDTPAILSEILCEKGWRLRTEITLRPRLSRGGLRLRQVLLAAEAPHPLRRRATTPTWREQWEDFKKDLPHQKGEFAKRNWGSPLHSLCSYQGKMKPSLAHHLVETFVPRAGRMLDPFGGVGTIPFEAACLGAEAWSFDISPAAVPIAMAKLQPATASDCSSVLERLDACIEAAEVREEDLRSAMQIRFNGALTDYFHPETFREILLARRFFLDLPPTDAASALVFASLLHVLHGNRPYALSRRSHPITPFAPTGEPVYKKLTEKVGEKVERAFAVDRPSSFVRGEALYQDATGPWPIEVDNLDAVITSPPFFDSTRFYLANWMRLWFAGWNSDEFKQMPLAFIDERQKTNFRVYEPILRQARERLTPGGVCILHLGKSRKCDMAKEVASIAKRWFTRSEIFGESVGHCESHGIRDKGTVVEHSYLVLY
jgi:DNA modification methylase